MREVWGSSLFLYLSDALLLWAFLLGVAAAVRRVAGSLFWVFPSVTRSDLVRFCVFQLVWVFLGLVGFKFVIEGSLPHSQVDHILGGMHGSDQYSTVAEAFGALFVLWGVVRLLRRWARVFVPAPVEVGL